MQHIEKSLPSAQGHRSLHSASLLPPLNKSCQSRLLFSEKRLRGAEHFGKTVQQELRAAHNCYGCGAAVQTSSQEAPGYVEPERFAQKQQFKQLDQLLCRRCRELSHGAVLPAVEESWMKATTFDTLGGQTLVTPEQLRLQLAGIREQRALVVLLVDLLDASGSFLARLRDLTGRNPVVLIGTKADLLPKELDMEGAEAWLSNTAAAKKLNIIHTCAVSSRSGTGIQAAAAFIRQQRLGRDVYIVGAANVGKSAFIRALMQDMSDFSSRQFDAAAANTAKRLPVVSAVPGTTLGLITLRAFATGGRLIEHSSFPEDIMDADTPGLHLQHRIQHQLAPGILAKLQPAGRLRSIILPPLAEAGRPSVQPSSRCIFFVPKGTKVIMAPLGIPNEEAVLNEQPSSKENGRLQDIELFIREQATLQAGRRPSVLADVAVSGLPGWASISAHGPGAIHVRVWAPIGVKTFIRPPMPCSGSLDAVA